MAVLSMPEAAGCLPPMEISTLVGTRSIIHWSRGRAIAEHRIDEPRPPPRVIDIYFHLIVLTLNSALTDRAGGGWLHAHIQMDRD